MCQCRRREVSPGVLAAPATWCGRRVPLSRGRGSRATIANGSTYCALTIKKREGDVTLKSSAVAHLGFRPTQKLGITRFSICARYSRVKLEAMHGSPPLRRGGSTLGRAADFCSQKVQREVSAGVFLKDLCRSATQRGQKRTRSCNIPALTLRIACIGKSACERLRIHRLPQRVKVEWQKAGA